VPIKKDNRIVGAISADRPFEGKISLEKGEKLLSVVAAMVANHVINIEKIRVEKEQLKTENIRLKSQLESRYRFDNIIGNSNKMREVLQMISQVSSSPATVLIRGESGTGKELVANSLHFNSNRNKKPFIKINCAAIPENLIESELFGHEKGAFTGADKRKIGCIEMADQGTLFLDEVGELPLAAQAKLLRALQEKTIRRVGGVASITADFRLITATNRNLATEVEQKRFREDLFYRLNVIPFKLPPLRKRSKDPLLLAQHFIERYTKKYKFPMFKLTADEKNSIMKYPWPGNIRELENVIERAVLLSNGKNLELDLPLCSPSSANDPFIDKPTLDEIQRRYIAHILDYTKGKISGTDGACEILGMKRSSFYSRMKALGFKKNKT
jgi:Nif-specific regulatory protein